MVLVEQQAGGQVAKALVGEARRREELEAFDLAKVRPLTQGKEVEKLCYIVAPAMRVSAGQQRSWRSAVELS